MLRRQVQHASSDTALARVGSADCSPCCNSSCSQHFQQATALAAHGLGGHNSVMPEPYSVNNASRSQKGTTHLRLLLLLEKKIAAARGVSATVSNYAGQAILGKSSTKRSSSKNRAGIAYAMQHPDIVKLSFTAKDNRYQSCWHAMSNICLTCMPAGQFVNPDCWMLIKSLL